MKRFIASGRLTILLLVAVGISGCMDKPSSTGESGGTSERASSAGAKPNETDDVAVERAKLSPGDRALVEAQEWCVISADSKLGSMGSPIKLDIKGQAIFVCCKGCKGSAERDPDKTLTKVEELKAKVKAEKGNTASPARR